VGSVAVIVVFPGSQHEASFGEGREGGLVQKLIAQLALLIPCLRQTSAVFNPASCSRKTPMICSSVNLLFLIVQLLLRPSDPIHFWISLQGSGQQL
jgi:hypothetical protein